MASDPIEHVVVLMMENRSFDHMLGYMKQIYAGIAGIDTKSPLCNPDPGPGAQSICQSASPRDTTDPDPMHEVANVLQQLDAPGKCQGFVQDYAASHADKEPFDHGKDHRGCSAEQNHSIRGFKRSQESPVDRHHYVTITQRSVVNR